MISRAPTRLASDEAMRQHMRAMRKAFKEGSRPMKETLEAKMQEHQDAIAKAKAMAHGLQEQMQGLMTDVVRREGAIMALRELLSADAPPEMATDG